LDTQRHHKIYYLQLKIIIWTAQLIQLVARRAEENTKDFQHFEFPTLMFPSLKR